MVPFRLNFGLRMAEGIGQSLNLEREFHHTASKLCMLGFEPLKQGTKIDGQHPGTSQRFPLWRL